MQPAPGTWGSFVAIPFAIMIYAVTGWMGLLLAAALLYPVGHWSASKFAASTGVHDDKMIVIDEVIGQWIALIPALMLQGTNPVFILLAFGFFRFFDILKPWPVSHFDTNMPNAHGVLLDDVAAGAAAALMVFGAITAWGAYVAFA